MGESSLLEGNTPSLPLATDVLKIPRWFLKGHPSLLAVVALLFFSWGRCLRKGSN